METSFDIKKVIFLILLLAGAVLSARVYGLDGKSVAIMEKLLEIIVVLLVAMIAWIVYKHLISHIIAWLDNPDTTTTEAVLPLFDVMGKIIIVFATVFAVMSIIGVNLWVALTSAGIVGLAVSFGAQNTLSQFFSGMSIMMAHSFKAGDVVMIEGRENKLEVMKIGLMNTTLREWDNAQIYNVPNNKMADAVVINLTASKGVYCMLLFLEMSYDTDFENARKTILGVTERTEHVIRNDERYASTVEVDNFNTSTITLKVTTYLDDFIDHGMICSDIRQGIVDDFMKQGISLVRNTRHDIYMKN